MQKWTQDEAIAYESACEAITHWRAILTGEIYKESQKNYPDKEKLEKMYKERSQLFLERAQLHVADQAKIAKIRAEYGARIRSRLTAPRAMTA